MTKNTTVDVYKIGSKVKLTEDVFGTITGINVRGDNDIYYECGWWNSRSYTTQIFAANEVEITLAEKVRIGFI